MGAQGIETGTRGTVYFDDFESRRFSYIGTLTDPGVDDPQATNPAGWFARTYQYSATIPHAVTSVNPETGSPDTYSYDANGNMTCRVEGGITFKQDYNAENRISAIHKMNGDCSTGSVTESWLYGYDGDGVRVTTAHYTGVTLDSMTLYYMGGMYEVTGSAVKKYYSIAGQTVAMNDGNGLKYMLTDHLGSTSAVVDANGSLLSQQRYLPFGEVRTDTNPPYITQTDLGYTGQRNLSGTGLMDYKARFYSVALGRFIQPDSIIPNPANPQAFNRFSYVYNRPIVFTDPSGHDPWWCEGNELCMYDWFASNTTTGADDFLNSYGVTTSGLTKRDKREVFKGVSIVGNELLRIYSNNCTNCDLHTSQDVFKNVFGPISITRNAEDNAYCTSGFPISCGSRTRITARLIAHELGHLFNTQANGLPYSDMGSASIYDATGAWVTGFHYDINEGVYEWDRSMAGYGSGCAPATYHGRCEGPNGDLVWDDWNTVHEEYADMFLNWSFNSFVGPAGAARYSWMEQRMWNWLSISLNR
jgi:RHS repeat-associated protein